MIGYATTDATAYDGNKAFVLFKDEAEQWPALTEKFEWRKWKDVVLFLSNKQNNTVLRWKKLGKKQLEFKPTKCVITSCADGIITLSLIK